MNIPRSFRRTTDSNHKHPIAPDVLGRKLDVELPNTAWVTDVTYLRLSSTFQPSITGQSVC